MLQQLKHNLLGVPFIRPLILLPGCRTRSSHNLIKDVYSKLAYSFTGIGNLEGDFEIYLCPHAQPSASMSPLFSTRWCSLTCCLRLLPVWPMYTLEYSTQGMEYTTPLHSSTGTGSFRHISIWRRVLRGQNTTLTPRGVRTCLPWIP